MTHWGWKAPSTFPTQWIWPLRQPLQQGVPAVPRRPCGDGDKKVHLDTQPLNSRHGSGGASSVGRLWEAVLFIACAAVLTYYSAGMKEAWLKQPNGPWIERFWPNPELERDGGARPMAVPRSKRRHSHSGHLRVVYRSEPFCCCRHGSCVGLPTHPASTAGVMARSIGLAKLKGPSSPSGSIG